MSRVIFMRKAFCLLRGWAVFTLKSVRIGSYADLRKFRPSMTNDILYRSKT